MDNEKYNWISIPKGVDIGWFMSMSDEQKRRCFNHWSEHHKTSGIVSEYDSKMLEKYKDRECEYKEDIRKLKMKINNMEVEFNRDIERYSEKLEAERNDKGREMGVAINEIRELYRERILELKGEVSIYKDRCKELEKATERKSTQSIGKSGERNLREMLESIFDDGVWSVVDMSGVARSGDIWLSRGDFSVMFEVKNHSSVIRNKEIDKFHRDVDERKPSLSIMISNKTKFCTSREKNADIYNRDPYAVHMRDGVPCFYVSEFERSIESGSYEVLLGSMICFGEYIINLSEIERRNIKMCDIIDNLPRLCEEYEASITSIVRSMKKKWLKTVKDDCKDLEDKLMNGFKGGIESNVMKWVSGAIEGVDRATEGDDRGLEGDMGALNNVNCVIEGDKGDDRATEGDVRGSEGDMGALNNVNCVIEGDKGDDRGLEGDDRGLDGDMGALNNVNCVIEGDKGDDRATEGDNRGLDGDMGALNEDCGVIEGDKSDDRGGDGWSDIDIDYNRYLEKDDSYLLSLTEIYKHIKKTNPTIKRVDVRNGFKDYTGWHNSSKNKGLLKKYNEIKGKKLKTLTNILDGFRLKSLYDVSSQHTQ